MAKKRKHRKLKPCDICGRSHYKMSRKTCVKKELWNALKDAMDRRDGGVCQRCKKVVSGENSHMSHVHRAVRCGRLKFDLANVKTLCATCHRGWWHGNEVEAGVWFATTFPDRWEYIQAKVIEYRQDPGSIGMGWYLDRLEELKRV